MFYACAKNEPYNTPSDEQLSTHYCNDPIAINYNHGFPGVADNSVCIYPTDVFQGTYQLRDSVFNAEYELDTILEYVVSFQARSLTRLVMSGFCPNGDSIRLTADRYYKAGVDSTMLQDSSMREGHIFCRQADTISGFITRYNSDTDKIRINLAIASDTGINYHIGTGLKK